MPSRQSSGSGRTSKSSLSNDSFTRIGQIVGGFGLNGEVKVQLLTEFVERFKQSSRIRINNEWRVIERTRWHKERLLIKFEGVDNLTQAENLQWVFIEAPTSDIPALAEGEFLSTSLIGMSVTDVNGQSLGEVTDLLAMPAQDILVVGELMIPIVSQFVKSIDSEGRLITVSLIPGMSD